MDFFYSYGDFIKNRRDFKVVDSNGVNRFDSPSALYYKLIFYFSDENGLLGIDNIHGMEMKDKSEDLIKGISSSFVSTTETPTSAKNSVTKNTAYNFLLLNDELERAKLLKQFLILLSDINCESPWYFQELAGLDAAIERKIFTEGEVKLEDKPKQITIKCLQDAYDNRIGTLLDLYRSACFSYQNKKEIVPANLRKFNMGILIFNAPIRGKGGKSGDRENKFMIPSGPVSYYVPSAKLFELRNCEIDYNSAKSAFSTINTSDEAFSPEYTITINFDDCYESRYNEIAEMVISDFISIDINPEGDRDSDMEMGNTIDVLYDVDGSGNTPDPNRMKINTPIGEDGKGYWTNSNLEDAVKSAYKSTTVEDYSIDLRSETMGRGGGLLTSQMNNIAEKVQNFIQIPSFKSLLKENLHNNGTVNQLGEFEYLNRLSGMNGAIGSVASQAVGTATNELRKQVNKLYLGNIHGLNVGSVLDVSKRILSGDIMGAGYQINNMVTKQEEEKTDLKNKSITGDKPENTKEVLDKDLPGYPGEAKNSTGLQSVLPGHFGYQKQRTEFLAKINTAKSLRNNL